MPVKQVDLDAIAAQGCECQDAECKCGIGPYFFHARCHPEGEIEVSYVRGSGILRIGCRECSQDIANVEVAE